MTTNTAIASEDDGPYDPKALADLIPRTGTPRRARPATAVVLAGDDPDETDPAKLVARIPRLP